MTTSRRLSLPATAIALAVAFAVLFMAHHRLARHQPHRAARHFTPVHHLQHGGYCYNDGQNWWYYDTTLNSSGGIYDPRANSWVASPKSPADCHLQVDASRDASAPEAVEIAPNGQPEPAVVTEAEATELAAQVNDMIAEGNPNNQEMGESEETTTEAEGGSGEGAGDAGDAGGGGGDGSGGGDGD